MASILPATRTALLTELEGYEHMLFESMVQTDLDSRTALYDQWRAPLGVTPPKLLPCAMPWRISLGRAFKTVEPETRALSGCTWLWLLRCSRLENNMFLMQFHAITGRINP